LAASRPLTLPEINIAMNIDGTSQSIDNLDLEDEEDFKSRLRTLYRLFITIYRGRIYFLHQTAREFLFRDLGSSNTILLEPSWHHLITMTQAHDVLATVCVCYLKFLNSGTTILGNADKEDYSITSSHEFLRYSAKTWTTHFCEASIIPTVAILPSALRICKLNLRSYTAWFGIF
jgi:hypothetical protein